MEHRITGLAQVIVLGSDANTHREVVNNESYSIANQTGLTCHEIHLTMRKTGHQSPQKVTALQK